MTARVVAALSLAGVLLIIGVVPQAFGLELPFREQDRGNTVGESARPSPDQAASDVVTGPAVLIPAGQLIPLRVTEEISTATAQVGDGVFFQTSESVIIDGEVVLAEGTGFVGSVTELRRAREGQRGQIGLAIDMLVLPDGRALSIRTSMEDLIDSPDGIEDDGAAIGGPHRRSDAIKRGTVIGAGLGAGLGLLVGLSEAPELAGELALKIGAHGAAIGAIHRSTTRIEGPEPEVILEPAHELVIRVTDAFEIPASMRDNTPPPAVP